MKFLLERISDTTVLVCTILTVVVPWSVNRINRLLHKYGDPPWKKEQPESDA